MIVLYHSSFLKMPAYGKYPLPQACIRYNLADFIGKYNQDKVDTGVEQADRRAEGPWICAAFAGKSVSVYICGDNIRRIICKGVVEKHNLLVTNI